MNGYIIPQHDPASPPEQCEHMQKHDRCWCCCQVCNFDQHVCSACGATLSHSGLNFDLTEHDCESPR